MHLPKSKQSRWVFIVGAEIATVPAGQQPVNVQAQMQPKGPVGPPAVRIVQL